MAAIQVSCPACRQQFLKTEGEPATCPRCGHVIATAAEAAPALPAAEPVVPPPVPPAPPPVPRWYVLRDGRRTGPFDWAQMQRMVVAGQVQPRDSVWKEGTPDWVQARDVPELRVFSGRAEHSEAMTAEVLESGPSRPDEPPPRPDA